MDEVMGKEGYVMTNDGVRLHYVEVGTGQPVVLIPGWSQTVAEFKHRLAGLHDCYRLIALNMRGHGGSDKPAFGYTIARLSKGLYEVLGRSICTRSPCSGIRWGAPSFGAIGSCSGPSGSPSSSSWAARRA